MGDIFILLDVDDGESGDDLLGEDIFDININININLD